MATAKKQKTKSKSPAKKVSSKPGVRGTSWTFPKVSLEDALRIPKAIEDMNAGKPWRSEELAKAVGFNQPQDWRYLDLLRASNLYGLTTGSGANSQISLATIGEDVVAPSSPTQRQDALLKAFRNVEDFQKVESHYAGKKVPEGEFFLNTLVRDFEVPRDRVEKFSEVFVANLAFLRAFTASDDNVEAPNAERGTGNEENLVIAKPSRTLSPHARPREFLDSCFVMMPFGSWFDRYYAEIYAPAIRDAGFEPVRADELFSTGSVVEQIWEQIVKAKVLLADLTDKNANVFYELGLAHAAKKPVVFTARRVEDIPFDLRHLRVLIYETQEPDWSEKLKRSLTDFLKNAAKDPEKSIPNPFRPNGH